MTYESIALEPVTVVWTVVVWVVALAVSVLAGAPVTQGVLRAAARPDRAARRRTARRRTADPATAALPPVPPPPAAGTIGTEALKALRGGTWIGFLERFAITGCLLAGYPSGIAIVVAIKGLGRYPELREHPVASERFVVGTLASMCFAVVVGVVADAVLGALR
ncbi:hypothetical protein IF650_15310 [Cellulosimicrobium terreum]|nr:hypothetical protein [Cellulosimicrobium terreum]